MSTGAHPESHRADLAEYNEAELRAALDATRRAAGNICTPRDAEVCRNVIADLEAELASRKVVPIFNTRTLR